MILGVVDMRAQRGRRKVGGRARSCDWECVVARRREMMSSALVAGIVVEEIEVIEVVLLGHLASQWVANRPTTGHACAPTS